METLIDDEDFILNIVAQADDGASGNGDAYINLQRNSDPASAYIRWNLNPAPTPGSFILDNESWLLGIEGNDDFRLTRRTGIFEPVIDVIRIQDDQNGDGDFDDPVVAFPGGRIEIDDDITLTSVGIDHLRLLGGDFIPASFLSFCTTLDLGNAEEGEYWDDVVAQSFVLFSDCQDFPSFEAPSLKSNYNGLEKVLALTSYRREKSSGESSLFMNPKELIKVVPEAVHSQDIELDDEGNETIIKLDRYGIKYNQLIPVLIDAIQEQQEQIQSLTARIRVIEGK